MIFNQQHVRHLKGAFVVTLVLAGALCLAAGPPPPVASKASAWNQLLGPNRNSISDESNWTSDWPKDGPKQLWKRFVGGGYSSVSVCDGLAYAAGNRKNDGKDADTIYCFKADSGEPVWAYSYPCASRGYGGIRSTAFVDGNRLYSLSIEGELFCLDAKRGELIWKTNVAKEADAKPPTWDFSCSPLVTDKAVIVDLGVVAALNKDTGKLLWKSEPFPSSYSSPMPFKLDNRNLLAVFNAAGLAVLDDAGKTIGTYAMRNSDDINVVTPIVSGDQIFISANYKSGCALVQVTKDGLKEVWKNKDMSNHFSNCVLWKGYLYGFDGYVGGGNLRCMDFQTGKTQWVQNGSGSLILADGKLILLLVDGTLKVAEANPKAYKELASTKLPGGTWWTAPSLSGGRIYARDHGGTVVCVDVSKK